MVRWDADADRLLLLAFITAVPVQLTPETVARVADAFPTDPVTNLRPTAKAITERIYRMKTMIKHFGTADARRTKKKPEQVVVGKTGADLKAPSKEPSKEVSKAAVAPSLQTSKIINAPDYSMHRVISSPQPSKVKESKTNKKEGTKRKRTRTEGDADDDRDYEPVKSQRTREASTLRNETPDVQSTAKKAPAARKRATKRVTYSEPQAMPLEPLSTAVQAPPRTLEDHPFYKSLPESSSMVHPNTAPMTNGLSYDMNHGMPHIAPFNQPINSGFVDLDSYGTQGFPMNLGAPYGLSATNSFPNDYTGGNTLNLPPNGRRDSLVGKKAANGYPNYGAEYVAPNMGPIGVGTTQHGFNGQLSSIAPQAPEHYEVSTPPPPAPPAKHANSQFGGMSSSANLSSPGSGDHLPAVAGPTLMGTAVPQSPSMPTLTSAMQYGTTGPDQFLNPPSDLGEMFSNNYPEEFGQFAPDGGDVNLNFLNELVEFNAAGDQGIC